MKIRVIVEEFDQDKDGELVITGDQSAMDSLNKNPPEKGREYWVEGETVDIVVSQ